MALNMLELCGAPESRFVPVQLPHPAVQMRIATPNIADVALEMLHVDRVETDDCCIEAHVCFCDVGPEVIRPRPVLVVGGKMGFGTVKGLKERADSLLVRTCTSGEAGFVDAVIDIVVGPFVCRIDLFLDGLRVEID